MGDRLERLQTLRDQLTERLAAEPSDRDFATLSARLTDVLSQIESCEKGGAEPEEASPLAQVLKLVAGANASPGSTQ